MISEKFRTALGAFAMTVIVGGPAVALIVLAFVVGTDPSARAIGATLGKIIELIVVSVLSGGAVRVLLSIDARLEQRT